MARCEHTLAALVSGDLTCPTERSCSHSAARAQIHITVLNEKNEIKGTCSIDSAITVCTFAVGFGPATEPFEVTLVGSSCEKTLSQVRSSVPYNSLLAPPRHHFPDR